MDLKRFSSKEFNRGAPLWKEALWILCKTCFFLTPFPLPSSFRATLLRLFGASIGEGLVIRSRVNIWFPWKLSIGDHVWIGEEAFLLNLAPITIGSNVCVSQRAFLCTGSHQLRKPTFDLHCKPIRLEDETWIAAQAFIAGGVTVKFQSVVSAGSVVVSDTPPNTIVRGNPAVPVDQRYKESPSA